MNLRIKVKPMKVVADTKDQLMDKITRNMCFSVSAAGCGYTSLFNRDDNKICVFNLHKVNAKYQQDRHKKDNPDKGFVKGQTKRSVLIHKAHWVAYVYYFDTYVLDLLDLKVNQSTRNFKLLSTKK